MVETKHYEDIFLSYLLKGNRVECEKVMREFIKINPSIIVLYEDIFKNSLYRIGELWEYNKISVAVEHMATLLIQDLMNELFIKIRSLERKNKKILISSIEIEEHQVGGKMVADIFEKNSWDAHFLGANTPTQELVNYCNLIKPDLIGLSISVYSNMQFLIKEITTIRETFNIPIIIGGQALVKVGKKVSEKFTDVLYFANLEEVENYIMGSV